MGDQEKEVSTYEIHRYAGNVLRSNYVNFVRANWMKSYRHGNDYIKLMDSDSYFGAYALYITGVLFKPDIMVRIAVLSDNTDVTLGFSVIEGEILHYVFVKTDYRRIGIGRKLVPIEVKQFTHLTKNAMGIWHNKAPEAKFNPFT